ncbi:MAG: single-stranded DNA-binding protein [Anaerolineales bacterium]|jgi:single-strand DNA-binding protein
MTRGLNKVMLIGRLGQDPEMRYTPSGHPLTKLQLAVNRSWKSSEGEKKKETEWFNVVAWGKLAEICNQYLSKGQQVYIEGRLHTRRWQDDDGANHSSVEVTAGEMIMLDGQPKEEDPDSNEGISAEGEYPF